MSKKIKERQRHTFAMSVRLVRAMWGLGGGSPFAWGASSSIHMAHLVLPVHEIRLGKGKERKRTIFMPARCGAAVCTCLWGLKSEGKCVKVYVEKGDSGRKRQEI